MRIDEVLSRYLSRTGLKDRLRRASVVDEWPRLVGQPIAEVTTPESVTQDGTLFVRVSTAAWAQELQLMTPDVLRRLGEHGKDIRRIVWRAG